MKQFKQVIDRISDYRSICLVYAPAYLTGRQQHATGGNRAMKQFLAQMLCRIADPYAVPDRIFVDSGLQGKYRDFSRLAEIDLRAVPAIRISDLLSSLSDFGERLLVLEYISG